MSMPKIKSYHLVVFGVKVPEVRTLSFEVDNDGLMTVHVTFHGNVTVNDDGKVEVS